MELQNGLFDIGPGKLATIVTCLEMLTKPEGAPPPDLPDRTIRSIANPKASWYRKLYSQIGQEWLWFSRIVMSDSQLANIISDPKVEIRILEINGNVQGLLELDFRSDNECEVAFLGITNQIMGKGIGKWMLAQGIYLAWEKPIQRLWIHTCTLDHPSALGLYINSGFVPYKRQLEIADDPRLMGLAPRDCANHYPIL